ncbi:hypothetical protein PG990_007094 [Apiospora arundinis]
MTAFRPSLPLLSSLSLLPSLVGDDDANVEGSYGSRGTPKHSDQALCRGDVTRAAWPWYPT